MPLALVDPSSDPYEIGSPTVAAPDSNVAVSDQPKERVSQI